MKFKVLHPWNLNPKEAIKIQKNLKRKVKLNHLQITPRIVAGADATFKQDLAQGVVVLIDLADFRIIEWVCKTKKVSFPYIPGLLTFREGPVLEKCFRAIKFNPDVIIFDGQGIAHPRNMGLATHLGILLDKPTIGCAKTWLWGKYKEPKERRGAFSYLYGDKKKKLGAVLRTQGKIKPLYVSPGYKIDLKSSIKIVLRCTQKYRLPQPLRLAHQLTQT